MIICANSDQVVSTNASAFVSAQAASVVHKVRCNAAEITYKDQRDFCVEHDGSSDQFYCDQETRIHFWEAVDRVWNERSYSSRCWKGCSQFILEPRSEVWRNPQLERRRAMSWEGEPTVGKRVWQSSALVSPTTTLSRDAVPNGDDIEPVGGSRVDVGTGNEEEESLRARILEFEVIQEKSTSKEEREFEDCGHSVHKNWACVKDCCARNIFNLNRGRRKEENEQRYPSTGNISSCFFFLRGLISVCSYSFWRQSNYL